MHKVDLVLTISCTAFIAFFIAIEYKQIKQNAGHYFRDYWNYFDDLGLFLNALLLVMININSSRH